MHLTREPNLSVYALYQFGLANTNTNTNADAYMDVSGTKTVEGVVTRGDGDEV